MLTTILTMVLNAMHKMMLPIKVDDTLLFVVGFLELATWSSETCADEMHKSLWQRYIPYYLLYTIPSVPSRDSTQVLWHSRVGRVYFSSSAATTGSVLKEYFQRRSLEQIQLGCLLNECFRLGSVEKICSFEYIPPKMS